MTIRLFEVGGCVRDEIMGVRSKDVDFAVEAPSFAAMLAHIQSEGLKVFLAKEEFLTIRAQVPEGHKLRARCKDADFVLCRKDGPSTDGRRPDFVEAGTILDDLARRDFTINAIARDPFTGELIDPHGGQEHIKARVIHFVGDANARIDEDGLRVLRGLRFMVTKGFAASTETWAALTSPLAVRRLEAVSVERVREEMEKMFAHNSMEALDLLYDVPRALRAAILGRGLRLSATLKA